MKNLTEAVLKVMSELKAADKDAKMEFGKTKYQYVSIAGLIDDIRTIMIKHGLRIAPIRSIPVHHDKINTQNAGTMNRTLTRVRFRLSHVSGESEILETIGDSSDSADKGAPKCMTGALKSVLLQTFLLQGHDDPDDNPSLPQAQSQRQPQQTATTQPRTTAPPPKTVNGPPTGGEVVNRIREDLNAWLSHPDRPWELFNFDHAAQKFADVATGVLPHTLWETEKLRFLHLWMNQIVGAVMTPSEVAWCEGTLNALHPYEGWTQRLKEKFNARKESLKLERQKEGAKV